MALYSFHTSVQTWFAQAFGHPTEVQAQAWKAIFRGEDTLVAAPTGSGKTLAGFLSAINELICESDHGPLPEETRILYISPLKALSNDIQRNLKFPLEGIAEVFKEAGKTAPVIRVGVRTGDTSSSHRQDHLKHPPHILVTTPESFYILLTSQGGRKLLSTVRTLIIDEIHALISDKRGSHLALSVERLKHLTGKSFQRIGISATQKPLKRVAAFLTGSETAPCAIVDTGHSRPLELHLEVPRSPLTAVMANEVWGEIHERIVELTQSHRTTLIFVNTRRLAERLAHHLSEILGSDKVTSHHGSMSKEHRHEAEQKLKAGELKVLVATASMELGIDIGSVDLVIQITSPDSIAAFLQRVGRSGHYVGGTPKGIIFPLTRDDLVESAALLDAVRRGELDEIQIPEKPLDILAQQLVAEISATEEYDFTELFKLVTASYPYRDLSKKEFGEVVRMLAEGFSTRRGRRGAYIFFDPVNEKIRARKGARLAALTSGGAIPDNFDYQVVLEPENTVIGTLNEDFALESVPGDIFLLGNHPWMLVKIDGLQVRVQDASGQAPSIPFWLGEGGGRTAEFSFAVSRLKKEIDALLDEDPLVTELTTEESGENISGVKILGDNKAIRWLTDEVKLSIPAAEQLVLYLASGKNALGVMPSLDTLVLERFFDEAGDMHLIIHSPYGSRVNKGWGLALRKKFCRTFNFELQAAANEDSIVISLGSVHSFPVDEVFRYLKKATVRNTLIQAMLDAPLFEIRWRWNASRALAILRSRGSQRVPPQLQRMQAEDLVAQVFPDQIACLENIAGDREVPDHPLINQTIMDCLTEAMDIHTLEDLIEKIEKKQIQLVAKDLREPSPFAQEVINARPYAFLDDTPFEERRVNAIKSRRWLDPADAADLAQLDPKAIQRVQEEAWPTAETPDELADTLAVYGFILEKEGQKNCWESLMTALITKKRATQLQLKKGNEETILWIAAERIPLFRIAFPEGNCYPEIGLPASLLSEECPKEKALREIIRGRLEALGPVTGSALASDLALEALSVETALIGLETEGFVFRGKFRPDATETEWCERRLLHRIHKYTLESLRQSIQPISQQDYMRYLFRLHGLTNTEATGPQALMKTLEQLEGFQAPAASWETDLLTSRINDYDPSWLDVLCMSGHIIWNRMSSGDYNRLSPVKTSGIGFLKRENLDLWYQLRTVSIPENLSINAQSLLKLLRNGGALFFDDLVKQSGLLKTSTETAVGELVSAGLITCDSFTGLRALLTPTKNKPSENNGKRKQAIFGIEHSGRWSLVSSEKAENPENIKEVELERLTDIYLKRYGVIFRKALERETVAPPWRIMVQVLRRMEMKGLVRGGRFIAGIGGEQFALPETVDALRKIRKEPPTGDLITLNAVDPCNLLGFAIPGKKVTNLPGNRVLYQDGVPLAILEGKEFKPLRELPSGLKWEMQQAIQRRSFPPKLRAYLGKNYG